MLTVAQVTLLIGGEAYAHISCAPLRGFLFWADACLKLVDTHFSSCAHQTAGSLWYTQALIAPQALGLSTWITFSFPSSSPSSTKLQSYSSCLYMSLRCFLLVSQDRLLDLNCCSSFVTGPSPCRTSQFPSVLPKPSGSNPVIPCLSLQLLPLSTDLRVNSSPWRSTTGLQLTTSGSTLSFLA